MIQDVCVLCMEQGELFQKDGIVERKGVDLYACGACNLAWQSPFPSQEEVEDYYRNQYRTKGVFAQTPEENFKKQGPLAELRWKRYMEEFFGPEVIALDLACGTGNMMRLISDSGAVVDGVEANADFASKARDFGIVQNSMVENMKLARTYNTVVMSHILEHIRDPFELFHNLFPHLADGTRLFVEVPSFHSAMMVGYKYDESIPRGVFPHLWYFSPQALRMLLERMGWIIESCIPYQRAGLTNHLFSLFAMEQGIYDPEEGLVSELHCRPEAKEALIAADVAYRQSLERSMMTDTFIIRAVHPNPQGESK